MDEPIRQSWLHRHRRVAVAVVLGGMRNADQVEILAGLVPGERVAPAMMAGSGISASVFDRSVPC